MRVYSFFCNMFLKKKNILIVMCFIMRRNNCLFSNLKCVSKYGKKGILKKFKFLKILNFFEFILKRNILNDLFKKFFSIRY